MSRVIRSAVIVTGVLALFLALAFYFQWSWVEDFWPWAGSSTASASGGLYGYGGTTSSAGDSGNLSRLSFYFVSSIMAAIAVPVIWIGLTGELAAAFGGAMNLTVLCAPVSIYMLQSYASSDNERLLTAALFCGAVAVVSVAVLFWARRLRFRDQQPLPQPVRLSFAVFTVSLVLTGGALVLKRPNVFPWPLAAEVSVVYGWVFLGAATYFVYGLLVPNWRNAIGQLLGFLAYDLVLILPFLNHLDAVPDEHRFSLIVYTVVVILSGLLAAYYLFVNPHTRIWRASGAEPVLQTA